MSAGIGFYKGHGTENDFVVIPDLDASIELDPAAVARICDRRAGVGADGVLRVIPSDDPAARWYMDYRNADGSVAEMCGNGIRVFARFLVEAGLARPGEFTVGTRGGIRIVHVPVSGGDINAGMGSHEVRDVPGLRVTAGDLSWEAVSVSMGNPHAVVFVDDLDDAGSLDEAPSVTPSDAFPDGVNVEFVVTRGRRHIAMRVHERGSGETRSCGTGACAAAVAAAIRLEGTAAAGTWRVDVPGGRLAVALNADGTVELAGPAVLVAQGTLRSGLISNERRKSGSS